MSRKIKKGRESKPQPKPSPRARLAGLWPLMPAACVIGAIALAIGGLEVLKHHVYNAPEYKRPLKVALEYSRGAEWIEKEEWINHIASVVQLPADQNLMDQTVLQEAARQMLASGWAKRVDRVVREGDGTIRMLCDYRRPIAFMAVPGSDDSYMPVDREGFRLPGEFSEAVALKSGYMLIQGVRTDPPNVGRKFGDSVSKENDAVDAVKLAAFLFDQEDVSSRISVIDVTNYNGRKNRFERHIKLLTDDGRTIRWGSAIGKEVEEPDARDKLRNLAIWLNRNSPQAYADVSIYRNGVLAPINR